MVQITTGYSTMQTYYCQLTYRQLGQQIIDWIWLVGGSKFQTPNCNRVFPRDTEWFPFTRNRSFLTFPEAEKYRWESNVRRFLGAKCLTVTRHRLLLVFHRRANFRAFSPSLHTMSTVVPTLYLLFCICYSVWISRAIHFAIDFSSVLNLR
jgi:hypothetical protein